MNLPRLKRLKSCANDQGWGRIINITSVIGLKDFAGDAAYATPNAGQVGLTGALALELARYGFAVNAIAPGFVETDMTRHLAGEVRTMRRAPCGHRAAGGGGTRPRNCGPHGEWVTSGGECGRR